MVSKMYKEMYSRWLAANLDDPDLKPEENAVAMMQAADHVSTGLITYAARDSEFDGRPIRKGEIMALENGKIVATGSDITKMTYRLARSMKKKDSQFITVISGAEVSEEDAEHTTELVQSKCGSSVEVSHIHGGQPVYYYMLSVESVSYTHLTLPTKLEV